VILHLPSSLPMDLQMARARGSFAVPLNIFTSKLYFLLKRKNRRCRRMKLQRAL